MLSDSNYKFIYMNDNYFENEIQNISKDGSSSIEGIIVYYFKDENNNIIKIVRKNNTDISDFDFSKYDLITKYYITKISNDFLPYQGSEYDSTINIYDIGDFKILADMEDKENEEFTKSEELFREYDKIFNSITFPFTDEEFLEKNTKVLGKNYDGVFIRWLFNIISRY